MRFDLDDSPERRFSGVVTGVGDKDPCIWQNSKWRCLVVRWDDACNHQERVSPWDVHFSSNYAPSSIQSSLRMKRLRPNVESSPHSSSISSDPHLDFGECVRSSKVLQGQENVGSPSPLYTSDRVTCYPGFPMPINGTETRVLPPPSLAFRNPNGFKRSCKVHKQDSLVGRAVDLIRLHGYDDMMEGLLRDPSCGWRVLYSDRESDMMVVGDDLWNEFIEVVSKIHIYTQEEVEKLNVEHKKLFGRSATCKLICNLIDMFMCCILPWYSSVGISCVNAYFWYSTN